MKAFNHVLTITLAALTLLSCGSQSKTYYPMEEGLSLTYSIDGDLKTIEYFGERKLEGKKVTPLKISKGENISFMFFSKNAKGVSIYAEQAADVSEPVLFEEPELLYAEPFKAGQSWERDLNTTLMMTNEQVSLNYVVQKETETVTVEAGTFEKCMKVIATGSIEKEKGFLGTIRLNVTRTDWYAPKIGLIKSVLHKVGNHVMVGEETKITQLTQWSIEN